MGTALAKKTRLEVLEQEINSEAFEAFYHIGQKLLEIKRNKMFEEAGFKTWGAYCASGRIDYKKSQAHDLIRASELRPKLSGMPEDSFTVRCMLELCKCETDNDAKRVAKKAIAQAKKAGQRVTAKLIASIRDGADETGAESKRQRRALDGASLEKHLDKLATILVEWRTSLEKVALEQWEELPREVLTRVKTEAKALSDFLRS